MSRNLKPLYSVQNYLQKERNIQIILELGWKTLYRDDNIKDTVSYNLDSLEPNTDLQIISVSGLEGTE